MRTTLAFSPVFAFWCLGAHAEVFSTSCSYGDGETKAPFSIVADTAQKTGMSDYRNSDLKAAPGKLDLLKVTEVRGGLVGIKLYDPVTRTTYKVDYVRANRPADSPYTTDMESIAITGSDGSTTRESCGLPTPAVSQTLVDNTTYQCTVRGKNYPLTLDGARSTFQWRGNAYKTIELEAGADNNPCPRFGWHVEGNGEKFDFCTATQGTASFTQRGAVVICRE